MNKKISTKAVLYGVTANIVMSVAIGILSVAFLFCWALFVQGASAENVAQKMREAVGNGLPIQLYNLTVTLIASCFGGYVAGRTAPIEKYFHGGIVGGFGILLAYALGSLTPVSGHPPLWSQVTSAILEIPVSVLGAFFARKA